MSFASAMNNIENGRQMEAASDIENILMAPKEELQALQEGGRVAMEIKESKITQTMPPQEIIDALLKRMESDASALQNEMAALQPEQEGQQQTVLSCVLKEVENVQQENQSLKDEKSELETEEAGLIERREQIRDDTTNVLPSTRYKISLYSCVTGIKWDYECQPDEIKGYISTPKDVRPINLSRQKNSDFFITNYIWDLIGSSCETK